MWGGRPRPWPAGQESAVFPSGRRGSQDLDWLLMFALVPGLWVRRTGSEAGPPPGDGSVSGSGGPLSGSPLGLLGGWRGGFRTEGGRVSRSRVSALTSNQLPHPHPRCLFFRLWSPLSGGGRGLGASALLTQGLGLLVQRPHLSQPLSPVQVIVAVGGVIGLRGHAAQGPLQSCGQKGGRHGADPPATAVEEPRAPLSSEPPPRTQSPQSRGCGRSEGPGAGGWQPRICFDQISGTFTNDSDPGSLAPWSGSCPHGPLRPQLVALFCL